MSLVPLHDPDFGRFPRFREALEAAVTPSSRPAMPSSYTPVVASRRVARAVQSTDQLLVHACRGPRSAPPADSTVSFTPCSTCARSTRHREAWRALFDHYVFGTQVGVTEHIPEQRRGVLARSLRRTRRGCGLSRGTPADMEIRRLALAWLAGMMLSSGGESTAAAPPASRSRPRGATANVIPAPAQVAAGRGTFTVRARTRVLIPQDPRPPAVRATCRAAAREPRYLAGRDRTQRHSRA